MLKVADLPVWDLLTRHYTAISLMHTMISENHLMLPNQKKKRKTQFTTCKIKIQFQPYRYRTLIDSLDQPFIVVKHAIVIIPAQIFFLLLFLVPFSLYPTFLNFLFISVAYNVNINVFFSNGLANNLFFSYHCGNFKHTHKAFSTVFMCLLYSDSVQL